MKEMQWMKSVIEHCVTQDHDTVFMKERKICTFELMLKNVVTSCLDLLNETRVSFKNMQEV